MGEVRRRGIEDLRGERARARGRGKDSGPPSERASFRYRMGGRTKQHARQTDEKFCRMKNCPCFVFLVVADYFIPIISDLSKF